MCSYVVFCGGVTTYIIIIPDDRNFTLSAKTVFKRVVSQSVYHIHIYLLGPRSPCRVDNKNLYNITYDLRMSEGRENVNIVSFIHMHKSESGLHAVSEWVCVDVRPEIFGFKVLF